jgi:hypothetical protein
VKHLVAAALAALLLAPVSIAAHAGHAHKIMGTVSVIHENHLEVKDAKGKTVSVTLNDKTKIRRAKAVAKLGDLKVGDRVVVTTIETKDKAGKAVVTVTEVQIGATPVPTKASVK